MSTILKALRKIETETDADDLSSLTWPGPVQVRRKADERIRMRRIRIRALLGFGILILVFCGTWYFSHRSASVPPSVAFREQAAPPPVVVKAAGERNSKDASVEESGLFVAGAEQSLLPPVSAGSDTESSLPSVAVETIPDRTGIPELPLEEKDASLPAVPDLEAKYDSRIDLQAIAWSPEPAESFAVINNRILHEGQSFDGITITRIGRDDVSFQEMGREWREDFRLK